MLYGYLVGPGVDNNVRHECQGNGKVGVSLDLGVQDGGEHEMGSAPSRLARTQCGPTLGKVVRFATTGLQDTTHTTTVAVFPDMTLS